MLKRGIRNIHPGEMLREEVINANELTISEAAKLMGITRSTLSNILNEKSDISPEICFRIAAVFGGSPQIWADLQTDYNMNKVAVKMRNIHLPAYRQERKIA